MSRSDQALGELAVALKFVDEAELEVLHEAAVGREVPPLGERLLAGELVDQKRYDKLMGQHRRRVVLQPVNRYLRRLHKQGVLDGKQTTAYYDRMRAETKANGVDDHSVLAQFLLADGVIDDERAESMAGELERIIGGFLGVVGSGEDAGDLGALRAAYDDELLDEDAVFKVLLRREEDPSAGLGTLLCRAGGVSPALVRSLGLLVDDDVSPPPRSSAKMPAAVPASSGGGNQVALLIGAVAVLAAVAGGVAMSVGPGSDTAPGSTLVAAGSGSQTRAEGSETAEGSGSAGRTTRRNPFGWRGTRRGSGSGSATKGGGSGSAEGGGSGSATRVDDSKIANLYDLKRAAFDEALGKKDWEAAHKAITEFKLEIGDVQGAMVRWNDRIQALEEQLAEQVGAVFSEGKKGFDELIAKKDRAGAEKALEALAKLPLSNPAEMLKPLREALKTLPKSAVGAAGYGPPKKRASGPEFEAYVVRSKAKVEAARKQLAAERAEHARLLAAREKRAVAETGKVPIKMKIAGIDLGWCKVLNYDDRGVEFKGKMFSLKVPWKRMSLEQIYQVKSKALSPKDARGWYDLARYLALHGSYRRSEKCYANAVKADAAYKDRVPDLTPLKRGTGLFAARVENRPGDRIYVNWNFDSPAHKDDFKSTKSKVSLEGGKLKIVGKAKFVGAATPNIRFQKKLVVTARRLGGVKGGLSCIGLMLTAGRRNLPLMICRGADGKVGPYRMNARTGAIAPWGNKFFAYNPGKSLTMIIDGATFKLVHLGKEVWKRNIGSFTDVRILAGGQGPAGKEITYSLDGVTLECVADKNWVEKAKDERSAKLLRSLEYDLKLHDIKKQKSSFTIIDLDWLPTLPKQLDTQLRGALGQIKTGFDAKNQQTIMRGYQLLNVVAKAAPEHPAILYYQAEMLRRQGSDRAALKKLDKLVELAPDFYEGRLLRAVVLPNLLKYNSALREVGHALRLQPASADAWQLQGLIRFWQTHVRGLDELEIARILEPTDLGIRRSIKDCKHIMAGPNFLPNERKIKETEHYRIITNFSQKKLDEYITHLEALHAHMDAFFKPERSGTQKRFELVLFKSKEGYQTFAELTLNNRVDRTLGYYHPHYRQIYLFEGLDPRQTKWVMIHEAFHQYIARIIPVMPQWINEGLAEYFGATDVVKGKITGTALIQKGRLANLKAYLRARKKPVDFKSLMLMTRAQMYNRRMIGVHYAQAWAMTHFFFHTPKYKPILMEYLDVLRKGATREEAFQACWAKVDLATATKEFMAYVNTLK